MCSIMGCISKSVTEALFSEGFERTKSRGPDMSATAHVGGGMMGFHRLSIMDLSKSGMQPFEKDGSYAICNGELYGWKRIRAELEADGYVFAGSSDCEIILPMYEKYGTDMFEMLDAEFAMVIYDGIHDSWIAARDPIGIRPLYYGTAKDGDYIFASEPKNLEGLVQDIKPFPPGYYYKDGDFIEYADITRVDAVVQGSVDKICSRIHEKLVDGVKKRMDADAPVGFLLSGGLDSSLVCAIAQKLSPQKKIKTFAVGMDEDAIDLKYAREAAEYIGSEHHEIIINKKQVIDSLDEVIKNLGTYDITTIRASIGMYLMCKEIRKTTDVKVLLTGEISDELFGYKYTDFAPDSKAFQMESCKRMHELHMYDVLRADRCISANSMEARVPFGDLAFVRYVMSIDPDMKMNIYGKGKYLLRRAFDGEYLPARILYREKAAFSDAVGHSLVDDIKEYAEMLYTDEEMELQASEFAYHAQPFTKESLMYRKIFEKHYPGQAKMVKDFWMPNRSWKGCDVDDPSARALSNYGTSGI